MQTIHPSLTATDLEDFGRELDQIRDEILESRGEADARYIKRVIRSQRMLAAFGRILILGSVLAHPSLFVAYGDWRIFWVVLGLGSIILGIAKILENMEIGHNVLHGQWDWMRDPEIQSSTWEWDNVCPSEHWKHSHNVLHHTWTNVLGRDRDIGYGLLRIFPAQQWRIIFIFQPILNFVLGLFFEWGVALHELDVSKIIKGQRKLKDVKPLLRQVLNKAGRQCAKDYLVYPILAGPFFFYIAAANLAANIIRNIWAYAIIFCGHFSQGAQIFSIADVEQETRAGWYLRQLLGSCNISGGRLFHLLSGNLSFQIEHHLFPDLPSNRYQDIAPRVRAIAHRYGLPYNSGSFTRQYGTTLFAIFRHAWPSKPPAQGQRKQKQVA